MVNTPRPLPLATALAALLAPALVAAAPPAEPGVLWEHTAQMEGMGMAMPAMTSRFCAPKSGIQEPPKGPQEDGCQVKDVKNDGKRMTWKVVCKDGQKGEGRIDYTADRMDGVMTMTVEGNVMTMKMKGRRLDQPCDAGEQRRDLEARKAHAEEMLARSQASQTQFAQGLCEQGVETMNASAFADPSSPLACKDPKAKAAFCARLVTWKGYAQLAEMAQFQKGALADGAKACGKDPKALPPLACASAVADAGKDPAALDYISEKCPAEKTAIVQKECAGRSFTGKDAPAPAYQRFCTEVAGDLLKRQPAAKPASTKDSAVEGGKKLLKGLFGK